MRWPHPLRRTFWRIFTPFAALLVSMALIFSLVGLQFANKTIRNNAANELRILSVVLSRQVEHQLSRIEEGLTSLENHGFLVQQLKPSAAERTKIEAFLQNRLTMMPLIEDLALYNRLGVCIGATDPSWYARNSTHQPFFLAGLRNFNFSDVFTSDDGKIQLVSTPITDGTVTKGVLVGQVNMLSIYATMDQQLGVTPNTDAFLIDAALRFITPGKDGIDRPLESHLIATALINHLKQEFWVDQYRNSEGQEVLGTVVRIPKRRWSVVVERDLTEINRPIQSAANVLLAAFILLVVVLTLLTYLLTRSITRPLMTVVQGAQRLANGDFHQPFVIPRGIDELAFLASEFEHMRAKVAAFQENILEKLEESERKRLVNERLAAIGTLASTLAHEIRNPLNAMSLLLARLELSKGPTEARATVTRDLRAEIHRLDRLVSDILDYARPLNLEWCDTDLRVLIGSTLELYRGVFEQKGARCHLVMPEGAVWLRLDADKVKQCLVNLLQNGIDAISYGGHLEVEVTQTEQETVLAIRDDGVGLPAAAPAGRLFDLFFSTKEKGSGLGLSTVKKIMDAHHGLISIGSRRQPMVPEVIRGTEVTLRFPRNSYF